MSSGSRASSPPGTTPTRGRGRGLCAGHRSSARRGAAPAGRRDQGRCSGARRHEARARDEVVYAVLRRHETRQGEPARAGRAGACPRPPDARLARRRRRARDRAPPDAIQVRFVGACDGCPASTLTFIAGVKKAIEEVLPRDHKDRSSQGTDERGRQGRGETSSAPLPSTSRAAGASPPSSELFRRAASSRWRSRTIARCSFRATARWWRASRMRARISAWSWTWVRSRTASSPVRITASNTTCDRGECLTAPEVQLQAHAVRVVGDRVEVRLSS